MGTIKMTIVQQSVVWNDCPLRLRFRVCKLLALSCHINMTFLIVLPECTLIVDQIVFDCPCESKLRAQSSNNQLCGMIVLCDCAFKCANCWPFHVTLK